MTWILGLNAFHADAAACLLNDGQIVAAAEEERFRRIKHWAGFPTEAIRWCLEEGGIALGDVDHVAVNQDARANIARKVRYTLRHRPDLRLVLDRIRNKRERVGIRDHLIRAFPGESFEGEFHEVEHHVAHLASSFLVSPFQEAVTVSVDGFGDFASAAWGVGRASGVEVEGRVYFPHSLGIFYQAMTQYLGFPNYGDEYKVMGLAPYGRPMFMQQMREIVQLRDDGTFQLDLSLFRHAREQIEYEWDGGVPAVGALFSQALEELLGPARGRGGELTQKHRDLASSTQAMYEEAFFHLLRARHTESPLDALCISGGCGMNSVANGKVRLETPFREVYVQPAAGDAGGALGSALVTWMSLGGSRDSPMTHAYLGPEFDDGAVSQLLDERQGELRGENCHVERVQDVGELCQRTAAAVAAGDVVGWFQGRMEWGPRALGSRSIVCDPRRADMREVLNDKIKRRESFRPFAPSVLREAVPEWFEQDGEVPFMMQVYRIREEKRAAIPAVTHVDGTGRLQTVARVSSPLYHRLIEAFRQETGIPMVLNTSFNENEPIVCRPGEALDCFLRTRMDLLVMGSWMVRRMDHSQEEPR